MADIKINGVTPTGIYVGSTAASAVYLGNVKVWESAPSMADNTLKFRFSDTSYDPSSLRTLTGATWTQISSSPNVWLWDASNVQTTDWSNAFSNKLDHNSNHVEIIEAGILTIPTILGMDTSPYSGMFRNCPSIISTCPLNFPNATNCSRIFNRCIYLTGNVTVSCPSATTVNQMVRGCTSLQSLTLNNTNAVTNFKQLCLECTSLQSVPLFATNAATDVTEMFKDCSNVASGALALYTQMSTQTTPPATYTNCFTDCGSNTVTGAAELAQIPTSWGGTMSSGFTVNSVGSNLYDAWDGNYCFKSQRITVPAGVSLSATASFVWDNTDHCNYHGSPDAVGNTAYLVLANPSDSTKYVVGTVQQGVWEEYSEWNSYINLPLTWSGTLSSMFTWGNLTMNDLRDSSGNVDIYVCCTGISGGDAPNGGYNTIFEYSGDISDEGSVITVTVS